MDILFLDRVTGTFYAIFRVVNIAKRRIISNSANFLMFLYTFSAHVPEGQRLQHLVDRIALAGCFVSQFVLLTHQHFGGVATEQRE